MGRAAVELAVSQPVVSKAMSELEDALGFRLLDRSPQGVEPTRYGRAVIKWAVAAFDDLRHGVNELEFLADPTVGELKIGTLQPLAAGFVMAVVARLSRQYPKVCFEVVHSDAVLLRTYLRERHVEVVVGPMIGPDLEDDIAMEILFDERFVVMVGRSSKWARRRNVTLTDLMDEPWVLPPRGSNVGAHMTQGFRAAGVEPPRIHVATFSVSLTERLVASESFVTVVPRTMASFGRHLPLKVLPIELPTPPRPTGIMTLKNRLVSPLADLFIECARDLARSPTAGLRKSGKRERRPTRLND
jgi:DNA-binding transcriptional LysR family regulator